MKPNRLPFISSGKLLLCAAALALLAVHTARADYPSTILGDHPVVYYRLEELPGAGTITDSSSNGLTGATVDYDLDTNGVPDYPLFGQAGIDTNSVFFKTYTDNNSAFHYGQIDIPWNALFAPVAADGVTGTAFSAECWVQATTQPNDYKVPLADFGAYGGGIYANASGWNIYQSPGPGSYWIFNMKNGAFIQASGIPISLLQWYHLAATFDGTNVTFYVNSVSQGTFNASGYLANPSTDIFIGSGPATGFGPFDGGVDEAAFYNYALTSAQVTAHYQLGTNSFRLVPTAAGILQNPASSTNYSGTTATFAAAGSGTLPLSYQWYRGTTAIPGATGNAYSLTCHYPADNNAMFSVVVSNFINSMPQRATSSVATLTVLTNINIIAPPNSITRNIGSNSWYAFRVAATGALPISYQWYNDVTSAAIPGATGATLWVKGVSTNASYHARVTNPFQSTDLPTVTMTPQTRPMNVPVTGYARVVEADLPVAYWRLDEVSADNGTATDAVGTFDGTYNDAAGSFLFGAPTGIPHETDGAVGLTNGSNIQIPFAVELNSDTAWSMESWLQPYSLGANGGDYRVALSSEFNEYPNPYNGWYLYQQPNNTFAFVPQPGNGFIVAGPDDPAHGNQLVANNWYHLVVTDDGTTFTVYINGEARSSFPVSGIPFIPNGTGIIPNGDGIAGDGTLGVSPGLGNTVLGQRTDAAFGTFIGAIDDTAVYNYALSPQQVHLHFLNTVKLTIIQSGSSVILSWPFGTLQSATAATGTYTDIVGATSPYTNSVSGPKKFYRVRIPSS